MKDRRYSMESYYRKCIEITGRYLKKSGELEYENNVDLGELMPKTTLVADPKTDMITPLYYIDEEKYPKYEKAIQHVKKGSILVDVKGTEKYADVCEDHIILQCNINLTYGIPYGSRVCIYGLVGAYEGKNKIDKYDYCIEQIINIKQIKD